MGPRVQYRIKDGDVHREILVGMGLSLGLFNISPEEQDSYACHHILEL